MTWRVGYPMDYPFKVHSHNNISENFACKKRSIVYFNSVALYKPQLTQNSAGYSWFAWPTEVDAKYT